MLNTNRRKLASSRTLLDLEIRQLMHVSEDLRAVYTALAAADNSHSVWVRHVQGPSAAPPKRTKNYTRALATVGQAMDDIIACMSAAERMEEP